MNYNFIFWEIIVINENKMFVFVNDDKFISQNFITVLLS